MKEQTENMRTVCDVLGEAQEVMQELTKKLRNTPDSSKLDTKPDLEEEQTLILPPDAAEELLRINIGTQVKFGKKTKPSAAHEKSGTPALTKNYIAPNQQGFLTNLSNLLWEPVSYSTFIVSDNNNTNDAHNENPSIRAFEKINQSVGSEASAKKNDENQPTTKKCTKSDCPAKIQTIPPVDGPRRLVIQNVPVIVTSVLDEEPQTSNPLYSNVGFLIVKHVSDEDNNELVDTTVSPCSNQSDLKEIASEKQLMSVELQSPKESDHESNEFKNEAVKDCISNGSNSRISKNDSSEESVTDEFTNLTVSRNSTSLSATTASRYSYNSRRKRHVSVAVDTFTVFPEDDDPYSIISSNCELKTSISNDSPEKALSESANSLVDAITEFRNHQFKSESHSELSNQGKDDYRKSSYDTITSRKSNFAEFLSTRENEPCKTTTKRFIKEMTKDPYANDLYKSYQLVADQSAHEPDEELDDADIASIDEDVYKTFVNPNRRPTINRQSVCKYVEPEPPAPIKTPFQFYATKSTQCDETSIGGTKPRVLPDHVVVLKEPTSDTNQVSEIYLKTHEADDNISGFISVAHDGPQPQSQPWSSISYSGLCDDLEHGWRSNSVKPQNPHDPDLYRIQHATEKIDLLQPSPEAVLEELSKAVAKQALGTDSVSLKSDMNTSSTRLQGQKFTDAMDAISLASSNLTKQRSSISNSSKGFPSPTHTESSRRPQHKHPSILAELDESVAKKMAEAARQRDTASNKSENTEDVIFEIDRETLRLENDNLSQAIDEISLAPSHHGRERRSLNQRYSFIGSTADLRSIASDYVVTHDISMQTSLVNLSDVFTSPLKYSKSAFDKDVESLKAAMAEDDEAAPSTSCFPRLCWSAKKRERGGGYLKRPEQNPTPRKSLLATTSSGTIVLGGDEMLSFPERVRGRLSRRQVSPVESFISELTNVKKGDIETVRNAHPQPNVMNVFDDYKASEVIDLIKTASKAWSSERDGQISTQDSRKSVPQTLKSTTNNQEQKYKESKNDKSSRDSVVIMAFTVEHPKISNHQGYYSKPRDSSNSCSSSILV